MPDPLDAVLIPLLADELNVAPALLRPEARLYHDLDVSGEKMERLFQRLGRTFGVNLTALNENMHWPTGKSSWSPLDEPIGDIFFPITVADIADWVRTGEFHYDYTRRRPVPRPKNAR